MISIEEILEIKKHYVDELYSQVRVEQEKDASYINDNFSVPEIKEPHQLYRSGIGDRIVNAPAEHIVTSNPQVFFHPRKETDGTAKSALKLSAMINQVWIPLLQKQNPNIFKEFIKDQLGRGEAYFRVAYDKTGIIPIRFMVLDPMVIYGSPEESVEGIPDKVVVFYNLAQWHDLIPKYPFLKDITQKQIEWLEYYDDGARYVGAQGNDVTDGGVQPNVYGITPFVRKYSGFGRRSPDGELSSLIVSDIKRSRDLVREECATRSNIASIEYLFAHKPHTFIGPGVDAQKIRESISYGAYDLNAIDIENPAMLRIEKLEITPSPETYKHHADIINELNQRHPFILAGFPFGSSGRQQDMTLLSAMRRYDSVVENTEHAFATAIKIALKMCAAVPGLKLEGISQKDLDTEFDIEVKLKAKDPIEEDRKITLGDRLWSGGKGSISLQTFHTQYQGMTQDESNKEIARMLADQITIYNPDVAMVMGMVAAEETGMSDWLEKARAKRQIMDGQPGIRQQLPATSQERIRGEVETPMGFEEASPRGARQSPDRFNRGGV